MLGIFLDTETTGLDPFIHSVLEIAIKIVDLATGKEKACYSAPIRLTQEQWKKAQKESLAINCFTWEETKQGKSVQEVGEEIIALFSQWNIQRGKAVFICQNPSFDRPFFSMFVSAAEIEKRNWPYHWLDLASMHFAKLLLEGRTLPWEAGLSKDNIASYYHLPAEKNPHRALNGVNHLLLCYTALLGFPSNS